MLSIDYVSDVHLKFYCKEACEVPSFVSANIKPKVKSDILVIAGDICEYFDYLDSFIVECSKYYQKVIFIAGNHEYYIPNMKFFYMDPIGKEFDFNSLNKIKKLEEMYSGSNDIIFLDRNASNAGVCTIDGYKIAGDTMWYVPKNLLDWLYNYPCQNDRGMILTSDSKSNQIKRLHEEGIKWYNLLPNDIDLMISHVPPMRIKNNDRGYNGCYFNNLSEFKSKNWIYGHDHKPNTLTKGDTLLTTNPWGYNSKEFPIKTLVLK